MALCLLLILLKFFCAMIADVYSLNALQVQYLQTKPLTQPTESNL